MGVLAEVAPYPLGEGLDADEGDQQFQHGCTLGVGDAVEVLFHLFQVAHVSGDGVGGGQLVLQVGPGLAFVRERGPRVGSRAVLLGDLVSCEVGGPLGERLVEPQIVPPAHRHQVAEPHVGQLVEDGVVAGLHLAGGDAGTEQILVTEGNAARVFHGAKIELGHEDLVVGVEGVGHPEG